MTTTRVTTQQIGDGQVATADLADNAVTDAKFRQSAALSVVGRSANSTGNVADIAAGSDGHVLRRSGTTVAFGTVATAGIADGAITEAKQTLANNTTNNVSTSAHGYAPILDNNANHFFNGQGGYTAPDHGNLGGLSDDDHAQYALLAGRSGGQTLKGGTASGNALALYGTAHSGRGPVQVYDNLQIFSKVGLGRVDTISGIAADQNNLSGTYPDDVNVMVVDSTSTYGITGIYANGSSQGRLLVLWNNGSYVLYLRNNDSNSSSGNRFSIGADYPLMPGEKVLLQWGVVASAWNIVCSSLPHPLVIKNYLTGLTLSNNGTDANNDIDIAVGQCADSTNAFMMTGTALTKQLDVTWAAGTSAGGLDTGSKANSTWYHVWAILRTNDFTTVDYLYSTSATSPTMPTGYFYKRRIGAVRTNSSGNIIAFSQLGDEFLWKTNIFDVNALSVSATPSTITLTVPSGVNVHASFAVTLVGSGVAGLFTSLDQNSQSAGTSGGGIDVLDITGNGASVPMEVRANTSSQIRFVSTSSALLYVNTKGWFDLRGQV